MYNKRLFNKVNDKKVLHKVKKQWVTISLAMLMMIGGGAVATHVSASANTTTKPQVTTQSNKKPSRTITDKANNLHKHLLAHAATKATTQKPKKVVNLSKLPNKNKKVNKVNKVNNVNRLHVNQSGLYKGNDYKRVTTPFNSVRINHRVLLHSNINSVGSLHNKLGTLHQGRVVRVIKAFEGYFNNDNYLRYEVPLTARRNAFITGSSNFVSYVAPTYNYHFYQKKLNHLLAHSRIKGLNGIRKMAKKANRKHSKNYKTYMKLYVKAFTESEAYRKPVIIAHHGHNAVAAKKQNTTNNQPSLVNSLENSNSDVNYTPSSEAQSYAPASYTPASFVPTPYVPTYVPDVTPPSNSASESSVAPSSASTSSESVAPSSASSSASSASAKSMSSSVSSNTSKASSSTSSSAKPSSISSSASKQSVTPSSASSSASKASSASNNSKVSSSASKASSANSNSAQSSVSSSASKQSVKPSSANSSSAQSSSATSAKNSSASSNNAQPNSASDSNSLQGSHFGLNYKYYPNDKLLEFTGGTLEFDKNYSHELFLDMPSDITNNMEHVKFDSDVDVSHVSDMSDMFHNNGSDLKDIDLGNNFDTSNVKNMSDMFSNGHLQHIIFGNKFNTTNVRNMSDMFYNNNFVSFELPDSFVVNPNTDINGMFYGDSKLSYLALSKNFNTNNAGVALPTGNDLQVITIKSPNTIFQGTPSTSSDISDGYTHMYMKGNSNTVANLYNGKSHVGTWEMVPNAPQSINDAKNRLNDTRNTFVHDYANVFNLYKQGRSLEKNISDILDKIADSDDALNISPSDMLNIMNSDINSSDLSNTTDKAKANQIKSSMNDFANMLSQKEKLYLHQLYSSAFRVYLNSNIHSDYFDVDFKQNDFNGLIQAYDIAANMSFYSESDVSSDYNDVHGLLNYDNAIKSYMKDITTTLNDESSSKRGLSNLNTLKTEANSLLSEEKNFISDLKTEIKNLPQPKPLKPTYPSDHNQSDTNNSDTPSDNNSSDANTPSDNQSDSNQNQDPNKSASDSPYKKQDMNHVPVDTSLFDEIKSKSTSDTNTLAGSDVTDTLFAARVAHIITDPLPLIMNSSDDQVYRNPIYIGHVGKNEFNPSKLFDGDSDAKWMKSTLNNSKYDQVPDEKAYNFTYKGLDAKKDGKYYSMYIFTKSDIDNAFSDLFSLDDVYETAAKVRDYTNNTSKYGTTEDKADKLKLLNKLVNDKGNDGASLVDIVKDKLGDGLKDTLLLPVKYPYYIVITRSSKPVNGPF